MSDRGESEEMLVAESTVRVARRPPASPVTSVVRCRPVAAEDGGQSDGIGAPRPSEFVDLRRRSVGAG